MSEVINSIFANADYFILLMLRVFGMVWPSPIFGRTQIPAVTKIVFGACFSYFFFTLFPPADVAIEYSTVFGFFLRCGGELLFGLSMGFVTNVFFSLPYVGGQIIDMQIGFGMVNVYDVQSNTTVPIAGNFLNLIMLVIFFMVNGHHRLIEILSATFEAMPVGSVKFNYGIGLVAVEVFIKSFLLGVMVAVPVIASGLTLEVLFGTLIRSVPQMNMFVVGIPIKTAVGLIMVMVTIPAFAYFTETLFNEMFIGVDNMLKTIISG